MKPRWLLLAVSLVCLLLLAPASMLSGQGIWVGCGTAVPDGVIDPDEWAPAAVIPAAPLDVDWEDGDFLVMNDLHAVYVASHQDNRGIVTEALWWDIDAYAMCFADEGTDTAFAGTMCPTSEGCYYLDAHAAGPFNLALSGAFLPMREGPPGGLPCPMMPVGPGVTWGVTACDDFCVEAALHLGVSHLDSVQPGDCLPMGFYLSANAIQLAPPLTRHADQEWPAGAQAAFPNGSPDTWGIICLSDCEPDEEFVPEPGTVMLLASGLMGMAGYAGLRLRKK